MTDASESCNAAYPQEYTSETEHLLAAVFFNSGLILHHLAGSLTEHTRILIYEALCQSVIHVTCMIESVKLAISHVGTEENSFLVLVCAAEKLSEHGGFLDFRLFALEPAVASDEHNDGQRRE